jgi:hypothetical protein
VAPHERLRTVEIGPGCLVSVDRLHAGFTAGNGDRSRRSAKRSAPFCPAPSSHQVTSRIRLVAHNDIRKAWLELLNAEEGLSNETGEDRPRLSPARLRPYGGASDQLPARGPTSRGEPTV